MCLKCSLVFFFLPAWSMRDPRRGRWARGLDAILRRFLSPLGRRLAPSSGPGKLRFLPLWEFSLLGSIFWGPPGKGVPFYYQGTRVTEELVPIEINPPKITEPKKLLVFGAGSFGSIYGQGGDKRTLGTLGFSSIARPILAQCVCLKILKSCWCPSGLRLPAEKARRKQSSIYLP